MKNLIIIMISLALHGLVLGQNMSGSECLKKVQEWEEQLYEQDYSQLEKAVYLHYKTKITDYEGDIQSSEVKVYRDSERIHFFSPEATMYQDKDEVLLAVHRQKLVIWNNTPEEISTEAYTDEFLKLRQEFLRLCNIEEFKPTRENANYYKLILKAPESENGLLFIDEITYVYDMEKDQLVSTNIAYEEGYKVKSMFVSYLGLDLNSEYKFKGNAWKNVLDRDKQPTGKFNNYLLVDNRQ